MYVYNYDNYDNNDNYDNYDNYGYNYDNIG
jgi:hypothetical protein